MTPKRSPNEWLYFSLTSFGAPWVTIGAPVGFLTLKMNPKCSQSATEAEKYSKKWPRRTPKVQKIFKKITLSTFQNFSKLFKTFQNFQNFSKLFKTFQNFPKRFKTFKTFQNLQNFSKLFKTFQNFLNFSKNQHFQQKTNFSKRFKTFQNF
jgi:hypothetical protein